MALIGSHATVSGGLATGGLSYAASVGAEVIQGFVSNPRGWAAGPGDPAGGTKLCAGAAALSSSLSAVAHPPRAGVCLDTCPLSAAGPDLRADGGVAAM